MAVKTFTTGEVLTAADTNTYLNNGGLVYIKSQTIGSGVSTVTVSSAFSSDYDNYKIVVFGGTMSAANNVGISFGSSGTGYYHGGSVFNYSNGGQTTVFGNNEATFSRAGIGNTNGLSLEIDVFGPFLTSRTTIVSRYIAMSTILYAGMMLGYHDVAASYSAFTFTPAAGTMTGGTITVYGYRKA